MLRLADACEAESEQVDGSPALIEAAVSVILDSEELKRKGNELTTSGQFGKASFYYEEAIKGLEAVLEASPHDDYWTVATASREGIAVLERRAELLAEQEAGRPLDHAHAVYPKIEVPSPKFLLAVCLSNRSLVRIKQSSTYGALRDAKRSEELAPRYAKAAFRRGAAHEAIALSMQESIKALATMKEVPKVVAHRLKELPTKSDATREIAKQWKLASLAFERAAGLEQASRRAAQTAAKRCTARLEDVMQKAVASDPDCHEALHHAVVTAHLDA